ncbi:hypothetical protein Q3G72_012574 [Acer saccharum]|nr:hypothetical protein Q3G72_012574 [Acer saccharum]
MIAGLGFEWALNPILSHRVSVNFWDINGLAALHWASRFGRKKMVAALLASGAFAGAMELLMRLSLEFMHSNNIVTCLKDTDKLRLNSEQQQQQREECHNSQALRPLFQICSREVILRFSSFNELLKKLLTHLRIPYTKI